MQMIEVRTDIAFRFFLSGMSYNWGPPEPSFHPEGPTQPRTGSVITSLKMGWRLILPIAVKRNIPRQVAGDLDVVARIHAVFNPSRLAEYGHKQTGEVQTGFVKPKQ